MLCVWLSINSICVQVPGYTRRLEREWSYSDKVCDLLSDYMKKYVCVSLSTKN